MGVWRDQLAEFATCSPYTGKDGSIVGAVSRQRRLSATRRYAEKQRSDVCNAKRRRRKRANCFLGLKRCHRARGNRERKKFDPKFVFPSENRGAALVIKIDDKRVVFQRRVVFWAVGRPGNGLPYRCPFSLMQTS